jgi:hypothetical protein
MPDHFTVRVCCRRSVKLAPLNVYRRIVTRQLGSNFSSSSSSIGADFFNDYVEAEQARPNSTHKDGVRYPAKLAVSAELLLGR